MTNNKPGECVCLGNMRNSQLASIGATIVPMARLPLCYPQLVWTRSNALQRKQLELRKWS